MEQRVWAHNISAMIGLAGVTVKTHRQLRCGKAASPSAGKEASIRHVWKLPLLSARKSFCQKNPRLKRINRPCAPSVMMAEICQAKRGRTTLVKKLADLSARNRAGTNGERPLASPPTEAMLREGETMSGNTRYSLRTSSRPSSLPTLRRPYGSPSPGRVDTSALHSSTHCCSGRFVLISMTRFISATKSGCCEARSACSPMSLSKSYNSSGSSRPGITAFHLPLRTAFLGP